MVLISFTSDPHKGKKEFRSQTPDYVSKIVLFLYVWIRLFFTISKLLINEIGHSELEFRPLMEQC